MVYTFKNGHEITPFLTLSRYNGVISRGADDFGDALVKIDVLSVDIRKSVLDRTLVHLQLYDLLLDVVSVQFGLRLWWFVKNVGVRWM
jgi:hypothetical protein